MSDIRQFAETLSQETIDSTFNISYRAACQSGIINFTAFYTIEGRADNTIIITMDGEALSSFEKNRIGFCNCTP